jgi:membrane fusion protein, multidrug efflux system
MGPGLMVGMAGNTGSLPDVGPRSALLGEGTVNAGRSSSQGFDRRLPSLWLLVWTVLLAACGEAEQTPAAATPPPAVSVVAVEPQNVTPSAQFVGRVVAIDQVDLRARVQGFLEQRLFTEGQDVKKGDLLYVIEQPPFQAQVEEAQADLARAEASVAETKATLERVQQASGSGAVSKQEVDQALANDQRAQAEVLAAKAQLEIAQLNLSYTEITAPIDGRIGLTTYTIGNLVGPDSGTLATIVSEDPIYVTFPVSSRIRLEVREEAIARGHPGHFVVHAQLPNGKTYAHPGKVNFLNIETDQTTDTITVRAEFPNPESLLVDGQFVNVTVEREQPEERLVVPQPALQLDQGGSYVLLVNSEDEVEQRRIQAGQLYQGNVVVQSGLQPGEQVIVDGIQKVRPGMKVQATVVQPPPSGPPLEGAATGGSQPDTSGASAPAGATPAADTPAPADGATPPAPANGAAPATPARSSTQ